MDLAPLLNASIPIQLHAFAALGAYGLGVVQLAAPKGTLPHRTVGYVWVGLMLVVGDSIIPPWTVGTVLCGVSVVLAIIGRRTQIGLGNQDSPRERPSTGLLPRALITLGIAGSVLAFLGDAVDGATYTLLRPAGPDGCQAVAREVSFLMAGKGQIYAVHPWGVGWRAGSWTADDGRRPIEEGTYTLSWGVGGGALLVRGDSGNPVWPGLHEVSCL